MYLGLTLNEGNSEPDSLDANLCQAKIMAIQYIGLSKSGHAKMLARILGTHLVWC